MDLKISIITCVYNSEQYLSECIESVKKQDYNNIEHIFVDGCSTDKTFRIINIFYENPIIVKREAKGIYDALNYGLENAAGDVIGFLHSDDMFNDNNCVSRIATAFFDNPDIAYYSSKMAIYDKDMTEKFALLGASPHRPSFREQLYSSTYFAHPTYYCRKSTIKKVGKYDAKYKIASDIDWLYRLEKLNLPYNFDDNILVRFRSTGKSAKRYFLALSEEWLIRKKNEGLSYALVLIYAYHFLRRSLRFVLEIFEMNGIIKMMRKVIFNLNPYERNK